MYKSRTIILFIVFFFLLALSVKVRAEDTSEEIFKRGILKWGSDSEGGAPYEYYDPNNPSELIGFEVDIIKKISEKLNLKDEMVQNEWDALIPALNRNNFDIAIAGLEVTETRKKEVNFTIPYYVYSQQIVVRKNNNTIINLIDLRGKKVGTLSGSAALKILVDLGNVNYKIYSSVVGAYEDLVNERTDAVLLDLPIAIYYAKPNKALKLVGEPFGKGYYSIAIRKSDKILLEKINQILSDMIVSGEIEKICKKWNIWTEHQKELINFALNKELYEKNFLDKEEINPTVKTGITKKSAFDNLNKQLPLLLKGAFVTLKITVLSMIFAIILGLTIAIIRVFAPKPFSFLAAAYVEVFRGTPLLVQLYIIYYGLPNIGIKLEAFTAAVLGLALNYAAYEAENYRAGIHSIPKGQMEAALSLGMTKGMALRRIIIPQAVRVVIPPVTNDFIAMFKDSSIVSVITMVELTKVYSYLASSTYNYMELGIITATLYFLMSYPASIFARKIEKKLSYERR